MAGIDDWQPRQFISAMGEMSSKSFLESFAATPFLLVNIKNAPDRLVSGLFHTSLLVRHDTPLMQELTGATDIRVVRGPGRSRRRRGPAAELASELLADGSTEACFLAPLRSRVQDSEQRPITVGRNLVNDIILKHQSISRVHATFQRAKEGLTVTDMDSKNGTWLNGQRIYGSAAVASGDHLKLGMVEAVLCDPEVLWQMVNPDFSVVSTSHVE